MFHTTHIHVPRGAHRSSALRTFIASSSFGPPDTKDPLRRGILLTAVAFVLLLIGSILTWLGFNDVFGGRMSMTGPLLIALSILLLLLSFRQFVLARKHNTNSRSSVALDSVNGESVTAVVVNHDDGLHPATIIVDRYNRLGYDSSVRRPLSIENDCAPPSYHEVTNSATVHDTQDELPPTYEETMGSAIYFTPSPTYATQPLTLSQQERSSLIPSYTSSCQQDRNSVVPSYSHAVALAQAEVRTAGDGRHEQESGQALRAALPLYSRSRKPTPLPRLQLEVTSSAGGEMSGEGVREIPVSHPPAAPQNSLPLPPRYVSAPASPRQLSVSPSPHPFSAPPSPRPLSPHQPMSAPLQQVAGSHSSFIISPLTSHHVFISPQPQPPVVHQSFHSLPSPHNYSAPSSPRPFSGQHSLTPPPQYTSAPPSPRQLSAPASPLMFHGARLPGYPLSPSPLPQSSPLPTTYLQPASCQLHPQQFCIGSSSTQPASGMAYQAQPGPTSSTQCWQSQPSQHHFPQLGNMHDGYTCFTYNLITPLSAEATPSTLPSFLGSSSATSATHMYPASPQNPSLPYPGFLDCGGDYSRATTSHPWTQANSVPQARIGDSGCIPTPQTISPQPLEINLQGGGGDGSTHRATFASRTDIQARI